MKQGLIIYTLTHLPTFLKFYYTNYRYKKHGFRKFLFTLFIEQKNERGETIGITRQAKNIKVIANYRDSELMESITVPDYILPTFEAIYEYRVQQLPFALLRDYHPDIFQACDHLTYKEVI